MIAEGKLDVFKELGNRFVELTRTEPGCVFYAFSFRGQTAHLPEGYDDAAVLLAHLDNVGAPLQEVLKIAKPVRLEVHGPGAELDKLRGPLAGLNPQWFELVPDGIRR